MQVVTHCRRSRKSAPASTAKRHRMQAAPVGPACQLASCMQVQHVISHPLRQPCAGASSTPAANAPRSSPRATGLLDLASLLRTRVSKTAHPAPGPPPPLPLPGICCCSEAVAPAAYCVPVRLPVAAGAEKGAAQAGAAGPAASVAPAAAGSGSTGWGSSTCCRLGAEASTAARSCCALRLLQSPAGGAGPRGWRGANTDRVPAQHIGNMHSTRPVTCGRHSRGTARSSQRSGCGCRRRPPVGRRLISLRLREVVGRGLGSLLQRVGLLRLACAVGPGEVGSPGGLRGDRGYGCRAAASSPDPASAISRARGPS